MGVKVYTWSICRVLIDTIDIFNIIKTWELIYSLNLVSCAGGSACRVTRDTVLYSTWSRDNTSPQLEQRDASH